MGRKLTQTEGVREQDAKDNIPSPCFGLSSVPEKKCAQIKNDIPIRNNGKGRTRSTIHSNKSATCFGLYIATIQAD